MPVILSPDNYERWLDVEGPEPADLLRSHLSDAMRAHPVSTRVNSPKNDDEAILEPLTLVWGADSLQP